MGDEAVMRRLVLLALAGLAIAPAPTPAAALSREGHLALPLRTESMGEASFGTVRAVLARLRRHDRSCTVDTYERGGTISCGARAGAPGTARVLIEFRSVPDGGPDSAQISSVRMNGVNGGELPESEHGRAVRDFLAQARRR